jgi:hypothetical protein
VEKDEGGVLAICPLAAWPLKPTFRATHGPSSALQRVRVVKADGIGGSGQWFAREGQGGGGEEGDAASGGMRPHRTSGHATPSRYI